MAKRGRPPRPGIAGKRRSIHFDKDAFKQVEEIRHIERLSRSKLVCLAIEHYGKAKKYF